MKLIKRLAIGLFATALLCLSTSSVLAEPTTTGFTSSVDIVNDIAVVKNEELVFGTVTAPTGTLAEDYIVTPAGLPGTPAPATGTFVADTSRQGGSVTVSSPSGDLVTIVLTPGVCTAGTGGSGTTPAIKDLVFGNTDFDALINVAGAGQTSTIGGTLTIDPSARNIWNCAFDVTANF